MKQFNTVLAVVVFFLFACTDQVTEAEFTDLSEYNMKLIPPNPTSNDEIKLVVYDDCTYNILSGINKNGNTIDIQKQFNSMMKWPCIPSNDTILLGKLAEGNYVVNYKLIDISPQISNPVALAFSFKLQVAD